MSTEHFEHFEQTEYSEQKKINKKSRCGCCKNKLILTECTCGISFCPKHIAPGSHCCSRILKKEVSSPSDVKATGVFAKMEYI